MLTHHQIIAENTIAAMINGPFSPAANMKLKWPISWLPRVKLTRLRRIGAPLVARQPEARFA